MGKKKKEKQAAVEEHTHVEVVEEEQIELENEEERTTDKKKKKKKQSRDNSETTTLPLEQQAEKEKVEEEEEEETRVKIEMVSESRDKMSPLVGYFPSAYDPVKWVSSGEEPPRVRIFRHVNEKRSNRLQLVVSPTGSNVNFVGTSYAGEALAPTMCNYALGVLDKETKTLKMVPIASNKIFRLQPIIAESEVTTDEAPDASKEAKNIDKKNALTNMYSTKKTIRKVRKQELLRQQPDSDSQNVLEKKMDGVEINKGALEAAGPTTDIYRNTPHHDMSATTPQMAYPLDKIINKGEWDYLLDIIELLENGAEVAPDLFPVFVCNRVYKLDYIKDEDQKKRLACVFSYLTHLVKFKDKYSMDGVSSAKYHKMPGILSLKFSSMFADSDSKRLSDEKKNLLISYVLVLTLFVDDFRSDPSDIAKDLRMNAIELRPHYENLGCKLVRENNILLATLPVPLEFPIIRRKRKKMM